MEQLFLLSFKDIQNYFPKPTDPNFNPDSDSKIEHVN